VGRRRTGSVRRTETKATSGTPRPASQRGTGHGRLRPKAADIGLGRGWAMEGVEGEKGVSGEGVGLVIHTMTRKSNLTYRTCADVK
jgi:hypothetical protein